MVGLRLRTIAYQLPLVLGLVSCGSDASLDAAGDTRATASGRVVNVYSWADYIDPAMLERFTAETGIAVNHQPLESNGMLLTKLLTGNSGFDVVTPVDAA